MPSSKKSSPKKGSPKKGSPKKSPKKSGSPTKSKKGAKLNAEEYAEIENKIFARKRYENIDAVFKQASKSIALYVQSIHIFEIWNRVPPYEQFSNSNVNDNASKSPKSKSPKKGSPKKGSPKKSPKKSPKSQTLVKVVPPEEPAKPDLIPALLRGVVVVEKSSLKPEEKVYVEIVATFRYVAHSKVPPFPANVRTKCQCYRDVICVSPKTFDKVTIPDQFMQFLTLKIRDTLGHTARGYPFVFNLTRAPDSVFLNRPYYPEFSSGLFWHMRAYAATEENCETIPDKEVFLNFYKYTIAPAWSLATPRPSEPVGYIRWATMNDTGHLELRAKLQRDVYYHGQEILVSIIIDNQSQRHVVHSIAVFVEQTYRLFHQFPHDKSIPLGEVILGPGDAGLPINPRSKNWTKEVVVKTAFDQTKYNLAIDGKMSVDGKVFLASSSIIMTPIEVKPAPPEKPEEKKKSPKPSPKSSPKSKKGSPKGKKGSPKGGKGSPSKGGKSSPKGKKPSPKSGKKSPKSGKSSPKGKKSPKSKSPRKSGKQTPPKPFPGPYDHCKPEQGDTDVLELNMLTNRQTCRTIFVSYDVVVRLNLRTTADDEAGHPQVRVPFILTRETRYLDQYKNPPPPTWSAIMPH